MRPASAGRNTRRSGFEGGEPVLGYNLVRCKSERESLGSQCPYPDFSLRLLLWVRSRKVEM
ncbi:hypothetical protein SBA2_50003 [Acidobacteriia bacterium SbA2]|nr:hypothetical protein SBA2_50003 [Acidobacteriia bacterium SbA2]